MVVNNVGLNINTACTGFNYIDINFKHCPSHNSHLLLILFILILNTATHVGHNVNTIQNTTPHVDATTIHLIINTTPHIDVNIMAWLLIMLVLILTLLA